MNIYAIILQFIDLSQEWKYGLVLESIYVIHIKRLKEKNSHHYLIR